MLFLLHQAAHVDTLLLGRQPACRAQRRHDVLTACALPMEPIPDLAPDEVCRIVCTGLQRNNEPAPDTGIVRLYNWMTGPGRVSLAPPPPENGMQGKVSLEFFLAEAAGPAIGSLMDCTRFQLVGESTITPGTQTRGGLATQVVEVFNDPIQPPANPEEAALVALLSAPDAYLEEVLAATREGRALPPPPAAGPLPQSKIPPRSRFIFSLEQERRPPLEGCWLLKELYHMKKTAFQKLNEGGEEFDGDDS